MRSDILVATLAAERDRARFGELARRQQDFLLRGFHFRQLHGALGFEVVFEHFRRALRHVLEEAVADFLARALERDGQTLLVGPLHDLAHAVVIDVDEVFEHEHQVADRHRQLGTIGLDAFQHRGADVALEAVEQLGDCTDAAVLFAARTAEGAKALFDDRRDAGDDVG